MQKEKRRDARHHIMTAMLTRVLALGSSEPKRRLWKGIATSIVPKSNQSQQFNNWRWMETTKCLTINVQDP